MTRRSFFFAMAALAALALSAPATQADSIVVGTDSGTLAPFTLSNTAGTLSLTFTGTANMETVNGTALSPTIPASFPQSIQFTATPIGGGTYSISGVGTLSKTLGTGDATTEATLGFSVTTASTAPPLTNFLNLSGPVTSVNPNNLPGFDFSNFTNGGTNNLTLTGTDFVGANSFTGVLTTPGALVRGSGSFSQVSVPEPTSMALLGLGLTGLFTFRRFLKRAFVA